MGTGTIAVEGSAERFRLSNDLVSLHWSPTSSLVDLVFGDGACALRKVGFAVRVGDQRFTSAETRLARWTLSEVKNAVGKGRRLTLRYEPLGGTLHVALSFEIYAHLAGVVVGATVENRGTAAVELCEVRPVTVEGNGALEFRAGRSTRFLSNGWERGYGETYLERVSRGFDRLSPNSVTLYDPVSSTAFTAGIFEPSRAFTSFRCALRDGTTDRFDFAVVQQVTTGTLRAARRGLTIAPGASFAPERVLLLCAEPAHEALETYAAVVGRFAAVAARRPVPSGWCTWDYYYGDISEEEVLKNLDSLERYLKPYGLECVLIDAGWQVRGNVSGGPWMPNAKFPHGLRWVVDEIHRRGFKAGVRIRPLEFDGMRLDASSAFVHRMLEKEGSRLSGSDHFDHIKIDFLHYDAFERGDTFLPEDSTITSSEALRRALEAVRRGAGASAYLHGSNVTFGPSLGILDANRVGDDIDANRWHTIKEHAVKSTAARYHLHERWWANDPGCVVVRSPLSPGQARAWASFVALAGGFAFAGDKMYELPRERIEVLQRVLPPFGRCARPVDLFENALPEIWDLRVETSAGAWNVVGLFNWDTTNREIRERRESLVEQNLAAVRENDRDEGRQRTAAQREKIATSNALIKRENARLERLMKRDALGPIHLRLLRPLKNLRESPRFKNIVVRFDRLRLDEAEAYLVYDFWEDRFLGRASGSMKLLVRLADCRVLAIHPARGVPQMLSTSRHVTQGAVDLVELRWDEATNVLIGASKVVGNDPYTLVCYVPRQFHCISVEAECPERRSKMASLDILKVVLRSPTSKTVRWQIKFNRA